jgi:biotin transport system substrate-specific component
VRTKSPEAAVITANPRTRTTPLAHALVPVPHRGVRTLVQLVLGVAFLTLLAQVRFEIGQVPITGQTLGVLLLAAAGGLRLGVATVAAYLAVGLAGLPVFSGGGGGLATLSGLTGGYLVGFLAAAALVGAWTDRAGTRDARTVVAAMLTGTVVIYTFGVTWLARFAPDLATAFEWGVWPFVIGDLLKVLVAAALLPLVTRLAVRR